MAQGGEGVARLEDGRTLFVAGALPTELVEARVGKGGGSPLRATLHAVLRPSPHRVQPSCLFAARCGGCDFMHIAPEKQSRLHRDRVTRALGRACGELPGDPVVHAPSPTLAYRSRVRLSVRSGRGRAQVGFRKERSHRIVEVDSCVVLREELAPVFEEVASLVADCEGEGQVQVALGHDRRRVYEIRWSGQLSAQVAAIADERVRTGDWAGARIWPEGASEPLCFGDPRPVLPSADGDVLPVAAGGFAQASDEACVALGQRVGCLAGSAAGALVELFAGSGTLSVMLAGLGVPFLAVENHPPAAEQLRANLRARQRSATVRTEDANSFVLPRGTRTLVLDPPRAGAAGAIRAALAARVRTVIYVSCDVATLARDLATLCTNGYRLVGVELFELFPQTRHVEIVAKLQRG